MQIWTWQKNSKRKVVCSGEKDLDDQKHQKRRLSVFVKNLVKHKEIVTKKKSGNQDSTNSSLSRPEKTLENETLQATTRSDDKGRGQVKAQTEWRCAVCQAERILNMCEIGYDIHITLISHSNLVE